MIAANAAAEALQDLPLPAGGKLLPAHVLKALEDDLLGGAGRVAAGRVAVDASACGGDVPEGGSDVGRGLDACGAAEPPADGNFGRMRSALHWAVADLVR